MARLALNEDFQLYYFVSSPKVHKRLLKALKAKNIKFHADWLSTKWQFVMNTKACTATMVYDIFYQCGAFGANINADQDA